MPYGVRKKAGSTDPRDWNWVPKGWGVAAMAPYKFHLQSYGITQFYQRLNFGLVYPVLSSSYDHVTWRLWDFYPSGPIWSLELGVWDTPQVDTLGGLYTVQWLCKVRVVSFGPLQQGEILELWPDPIQTRVFNMIDVPTGNPSTNVPNPVTVTPVPWDTPDSPAA
jgi:hypothetical protein